MKIFLLIIMSSVVASCAVTTSTLKLRVSNYDNVVDVYAPKSLKKDYKKIAFILLHPKVKGRKHPGTVDVAMALSDAGHTVYIPEMPYSSYTETLNTSFKYIDTLVNVAAQANSKVIVVGHSMGSAVAFLYCAAYKCPAEVIAVVMQAPGHMLQLSTRIQEATALDVQRARRLVKQGQAGTKQQFYDYNQGSKTSISTTPEIYLSYFDPAIFPNPATHLETMTVPVLWLDGAQDRAAARMGYEHLFNRLHKYTQFPENKYRIVDGGHVDMLDYTSGPILKWAKQFEE